jgi:hypothetical protein
MHKREEVEDAQTTTRRVQPLTRSHPNRQSSRGAAIRGEGDPTEESRRRPRRHFFRDDEREPHLNA